MREPAASAPLTNIFQWQNALVPLSPGKLPGRKILDVRLNTFWGLLPRPFDPTFDVRNIFKRGTKHVFLVRAMRAPIQAVHFHLFCGQTFRQGVVVACVMATQPKRPNCEHRKNQETNNKHPRTGDCRSTFSWLRFWIFALLRHTSDSYTTTFSAPGNTSKVLQCKVSTSPSIITSTGPSREKSMRLAARRSASGWFICVPS